MTEARSLLCDIYREYVNHYLSLERFAECNGLTLVEAAALITLARDVYNSPHPEE